MAKTTDARMVSSRIRKRRRELVMFGPEAIILEPSKGVKHGEGESA